MLYQIRIVPSWPSDDSPGSPHLKAVYAFKRYRHPAGDILIRHFNAPLELALLFWHTW